MIRIRPNIMTKRIAKTKKPTVVKKIVKATTAEPIAFAKGQRWQLELGYAEIVHVGKILVDYRFYRVEGQKRVPTETNTIREFSATLKKRKAQLIADGAAAQLN